MKEIKKSVLSLNVLGPMGDDTQEFKVGTNNDENVLLQLGTVVLGDDGNGTLSLDGDLNISKIKTGNATITFSVDSSTEETTITITGGTINLVGAVNVSGTIYQTSGDIIQYSSSNEAK